MYMLCSIDKIFIYNYLFIIKKMLNNNILKSQILLF